MHFDLQLGPFSRDDVCIALVFLRELLTQSKPGEVRMRNVLGRMVASHLVVGAPISRTQVKAFVLCDVLGGVKIDGKAIPTNPRGAVLFAVGLGSPVNSISIVPSRNSVLFKMTS